MDRLAPDKRTTVGNVAAFLQPALPGDRFERPACRGQGVGAGMKPRMNR